jgi:hypothetical protein
VRLAQHYNTAATSWAAGDFDYDSATDFNDLVRLAQNYNTALPAPSVSNGVVAEADLALAQANSDDPPSPPTTTTRPAKPRVTSPRPPATRSSPFAVRRIRHRP